MEELVKRASTLPRPSPRIEDCSLIVIGDVDRINPGGCYVHRIYHGGSLATSPSETTVPEIEGGLWIDYIRSYGEALGRRLRLLLVDMARYRLYIVDSSKPYSPAALSSAPMGGESLAVLLIPGRGASVFEKSSAYASYEIARRRAGAVVVVERERLSGLYGFTGERVVRYRGLEARVVEILLESIERVVRHVGVNRRIGVRSYIVSALIGASTSVYGDLYNSFRVLDRCSSWGFEDPSTFYRASSLLAIMRAPKSLFEGLLESYRKYTSAFQELLSHEGVYVEYSTRLGLYDIVALLGFPELGVPEHIVQGHRSLELMNPDIRLDEVVPWASRS